MSATATTTNAKPAETEPKIRVWILFFIVFVNLIGFGIIQPLFPLYADRLGASPQVITLTIAAYSIGQFLTAPLWGRLSDAYGRRPVLLISFIGVIGTYILLGLAESVEVLFIARCAAGLFAGSISASYAYMTDITSEADRARGMALLGAAFGMGLIFGPVLGGGIASANLGDITFLVTALVAGGMSLLASLGVYFFLPESLPASDRQPMKRWLPEPKMPNFDPVFNRPRLSLLIVIYILVMMSITLNTSIMTLWVAYELDYGGREVGYLFGYVGVISVATQLLAVARLTKLLGEWRLVQAGIVSMVLGLLLMGLVENVFFLAPALTLMTFGSGICNPALSSLVSKEATANERGVLLGIYQSAGSFGRVLGPLISGVLFAQVAMIAPFIFAAIVLLPGLVMAVLFAKDTRTMPDRV